MDNIRNDIGNYLMLSLVCLHYTWKKVGLGVATLQPTQCDGGDDAGDGDGDDAGD